MVQELVGEPLRERFEHRGRVVAAREPRPRLARARRSRYWSALLRSCTIAGHRGARALPGAERGDLRGDDRLGLVHGGAAALRALLHDLAQVVDGVEEEVLERGGLGLHVARHGEVDDEHRAGAGAP